MTNHLPPEPKNIISQAPSAPSVPTIKSKIDAKTNQVSQSTKQIDVSANNPCPFLRGLVAQGLLPNDRATLEQVVDSIHRIQDGQDPDEQGNLAKLPSLAIKLIAMTANGFAPSQILNNLKNGVQIDNLRDGPFDKHGVGSRILSQTSQYDAAELARLATYATPKVTLTGETELGLNEREIQTMLDSNAERAKDQKRIFDRTMMDGEFPTLLNILGKQSKSQNGKSERYLAVRDVETLFKLRQFPERIAKRINLEQR